MKDHLSPHPTSSGSSLNSSGSATDPLAAVSLLPNLNPAIRISRRRLGAAAVASVTFLFWAAQVAPAGAHGITVDGSASDWWGALPPSANLGRIGRNAAGQGEYVWNDAAGDERTDFSSANEVDITEVRVTGDTNGIGFYIGTAATPSSSVQVQITLDTDRVAASGQTYLAGYADTLVDSKAAWEWLVQTKFASQGTAVLLNSGFAPVAYPPAVRGANGIEIFVAWTNLGLAGPPDTPLRFTVATFRSDANDLTLDIGGSAIANALDVVSTYGDPGSVPNTWTEVSDQVINYYFDVYFQGTNRALPGEVYAPVLVDKFVPNSTVLSEMVAVRNVSPGTIDLSAFKIGDEETVDGTEGMYPFPAGSSLAVNGTFTVALSGINFLSTLGYAPDAEINSTTNTIPDLARYFAWASGVWGLANTGDEILLLDGADTVVDAVAYGTGSYAGVTPIAAPGPEQMARRVPGNPDTDNCAADFINVGTVAAPLRILSIAATNSRLRLTWQDVAGDYTVETRTNLSAGSWQPAPGTTWPISANSWTSSVSGAGQVFYRVKRQ